MVIKVMNSDKECKTWQHFQQRDRKYKKGLKFWNLRL